MSDIDARAGLRDAGDEHLTGVQIDALAVVDRKRQYRWQQCLLVLRHARHWRGLAAGIAGCIEGFHGVPIPGVVDQGLVQPLQQRRIGNNGERPCLRQ